MTKFALILIICFLLPAGLLAVTFQDVADARCDERCKIKDYQHGCYIATTKRCACIDIIDTGSPIVKLPYNLHGKSVVENDTFTVKYELIKDN